MRPKVDWSGLMKCRAWEHAVRFAFGGIITLAAGFVAHAFGPKVGGLFLAFPAILPASLTLVKQHDGRAQALDDARGGRVGSLGLIAFGGIVALTAREWVPWATLGAATAVWLVVDLIAWRVTYGRRSST